MVYIRLCYWLEHVKFLILTLLWSHCSSKKERKIFLGARSSSTACISKFHLFSVWNFFVICFMVQLHDLESRIFKITQGPCFKTVSVLFHWSLPTWEKFSTHEVLIDNAKFNNANNYWKYQLWSFLFVFQRPAFIRMNGWEPSTASLRLWELSSLWNVKIVILVVLVSFIWIQKTWYSCNS